MISIDCLSQQVLYGKYCTNISSTNCIEFVENNKFKFIGYNCLSNSIVSGSFIYKNNQLELIFDKVELPKRNEVEIINSSIKKDSLISLHFKITDESNFSLPANVLKLDDDLVYPIELLNHNESDFSVKVKKEEATYNYRIEFIGYETVNLSIKHDFDKQINIKLYLTGDYLLSDTTLLMDWVELKDEAKSTFKSNNFNVYIKREN